MSDFSVYVAFTRQGAPLRAITRDGPERLDDGGGRPIALIRAGLSEAAAIECARLLNDAIVRNRRDRPIVLAETGPKRPPEPPAPLFRNPETAPASEPQLFQQTG